MTTEQTRTAEEEAALYDTLGAAIAELLHLKKDRTTGRYSTSYGTKSAVGLGAHRCANRP